MLKLKGEGVRDTASKLQSVGSTSWGKQGQR